MADVQQHVKSLEEKVRKRDQAALQSIMLAAPVAIGLVHDRVFSKAERARGGPP